MSPAQGDRPRRAPPCLEAPCEVRVHIAVEVLRGVLEIEFPKYPGLPDQIFNQPLQTVIRVSGGSREVAAEFFGCICCIRPVEGEVIRPR